MTEDEHQEWNARLIELMRETYVPYDWDKAFQRYCEEN